MAAFTVVKESLLRDIARIIVWYPLRWTTLFLPFRFVLSIFRIMGDLHYLFTVVTRGYTGLTANLLRVFGKEINLGQVLREYMMNHYVDRLWIFLIPRLNKDNINKIHTIEGLEKIETALRNGKGCILLHGHFGVIQLPLLHLGLLGLRVCQIGLPSNEGLSNVGEKVAYRLRLRYEGMIPATIIPATSFLRPVFDTLRGNGVVMTAGEGSGRDRVIGFTVQLGFLGHPMLFPTGAMSLAAKTKAPVLSMFTIKCDNGYYRTFVRGPLPLREGKNIDILKDNMMLFIEELEEYVRRYPDHWHFWDIFQPGKLILREGGQQ